MSHKYINRREAVDKILGTDGRVFGVTFIKRTTGESRTMKARLGYTVKKGLAGGELNYSPTEKGLITAYLMKGDENRSEDASKNRRMIPIENIKEVRVDGECFVVEDDI